MKRSFTAENIVEAVQRVSTSAFSNRTWIGGEETTTYGKLTDRIRRLTRVFSDWGLSPGSRVVLCTSNEHEMVILFIALLRNGITAVLVDPDTRAARFAILSQIARPDAFIVDADKREELGFEASDKVLCVGREAPAHKSLLSRLIKKSRPATDGENAASLIPGMLSRVDPMDPPAVIDSTLTAYVLFTSGTTARPKGVQISHRALFAHLHTLSAQYDYSESSRILNVLKLHHTDGITQGPVVALANGCSVFRPFPFDIQHLGPLLDTIYTDRITHFVVVPTIIALIMRLGNDHLKAFNTPDFRFLISAADLLDAGMWESFEKRYGVVVANLYGLTETVTGGIFCGPTERDRKIGTVGKPVDCQVRIVDDNGEDVAEGVVGELLIKGEMVMDGYLNAREDTTAVLQDGWFRSGDFFLRDREGFYVFKGRKKMLIITGGINVHPEEVSEALRLHAAVADAVTFGEPDSAFGEIVVACVVLKKADSVTALELIDFCREHLEGEKVPARIHILNSLPRTAAGKPIVSETRAMVAALNRPRGTSESTDMVQTVLGIAGSCFQISVSKLNAGTRSDDVPGWDSLAHLEFITGLEQAFSTAFSTAEIMQIDSIADAIRILSEKVGP